MVDKVVGVSFLESLAGAHGPLHVPVEKLEFKTYLIFVTDTTDMSV